MRRGRNRERGEEERGWIIDNSVLIRRREKSVLGGGGSSSDVNTTWMHTDICICTYYT